MPLPAATGPIPPQRREGAPGSPAGDRAPAPPLPGSRGAAMPARIGRFVVIRVLGRGMQSVVYLAHDPLLERDVAIKALPRTATADARQLLAEARIAGRLRHPHIVPAYDVGEHEGHPYLVFEYVEGGTLAACLQQEGALSPARAFAMMARILDAIGHAHEQGVVHRDLKPTNVMIDENDFPRVMDFGIALRVNGAPTPDRALVGTPAYMAPEYVTTGTSRPANDIFACGLLLAEMLTARRVIVGANAIEAIHALLNEPIEMPDTPQPLDERLVAVVYRALERDPAQRFASAAQMKAALEDCLAQAQAADRQSPAAARQANSTLQFLLRRMRHRTDFPALSSAISAVNKALNSDSENVASLANTILQDFALTNKVLRLVNSAGFSGVGGGRISTITRAVQILGFDQVRNIAVGLMLFEHLQNKAQAGLLRDAFIRTLFSGVVARAAAPLAGVRDPEEAFVCAMFHHLGHLLSLFYFPEEWTEIQRLIADQHLDTATAAQRVLGASFEQLGVGTAEAWGFPRRISNSMRALPPGAVRRPLTSEDGLHIASALAAEIAAAAEHAPSDREAAFARIGLRFRSALPVDADVIGTLVRESLSSFGAYAAAMNLDLAQSSLGRTLLALASAEAAGAEVGGNDPHDRAAGALDTGGLTVLSDLADAESARADPSAAVDAQAQLSSGIQDLSSALVEGMPMNEVLRIVLETMYRAIGFRRVLLCVRDARENTMTGRFGFGRDAAAIARRFRFPMQFKPDVFFASLSKNVDILISDVDDPKIAARVPQWYREAVGARTFIVFPLVVNDKPFGMIYADCDHSGQVDLSPNVLKLLRTLRNQAVLAIKQGR